MNLATWERVASAYEDRHARSLRKERGKAWGLFRIPERTLRLLGDVQGKDVLELGCGAASWSIALAHEGARVVGLDFSAARLAQARANVARARVTLDLLRARAEKIPCAPEQFDIVLSDYGATTFTDPLWTIPEVARVLRTGGVFVFAHASPFRSVMEDRKADHLRRTFSRDYFGLHLLRDPTSVEYQLPYPTWIQLFSSNGLLVEQLLEPKAPRSWQTSYLSRRDQEWARHWPVESIWQLRKVRAASFPRGSPDGPERRSPAEG